MDAAAAPVSFRQNAGAAGCMGSKGRKSWSCDFGVVNTGGFFCTGRLLQLQHNIHLTKAGGSGDTMGVYERGLWGSPRSCGRCCFEHRKKTYDQKSNTDFKRVASVFERSI